GATNGAWVCDPSCWVRRALAAFWLSPREARAGREAERGGGIDKKRLPSPALSSFLRRRGGENGVARSKQIFCRTQLVCDPQEPRRPPSALTKPARRSLSTCC